MLLLFLLCVCMYTRQNYNEGCKQDGLGGGLTAGGASPRGAGINVNTCRVNEAAAQLTVQCFGSLNNYIYRYVGMCNNNMRR